MNRLARSIALPLLLTVGCSGGGGASGSSSVKNNGTTTAAGPAGAQTAQVDGHDTLKFGPNVVLAKAGTLALTFRNSGQVPHNLFFDDSGLGKTGTVNGGARQVLTLRLHKGTTYRFTCTFHPGMTGKVVVS